MASNRIAISVHLDRKQGNGVRRNTWGEANDILFLGWVMASLVFIILLFYNVYTLCIYILYIYQVFIPSDQVFYYK